MARYLLLGHLTRDLVPEGGFRFGGAVLYAGLMVRRLGFETHIITTSAEAPEELTSLFPELFIHNQLSPETTVFENQETPFGRRQRVHARANPLDFSRLGAPLETEVLHLAPVLEEIPIEGRIYRKSFRFRFLVGNPQGWFREVAPEGTVKPFRPDLSKAPHFHALVLSEEDLSADPRGLLRELKDISEVFVLTRGAEGASLFTNSREKFFPARRVKAVDPTGAGDILAGAFFALIYRDRDPEKALEKALEMAAIGVSRPGLSGVPNFDEIKLLLRDLR